MHHKCMYNNSNNNDNNTDINFSNVILSFFRKIVSCSTQVELL